MFARKSWILPCLLLTAATVRPATAQEAGKNITRSAGAYRAVLHTPDALKPGETTLVLHLTRSLKIGSDADAVPILAAHITPHLVMPMMASMTLATPTIQVTNTSGDYHLAVNFPHSGDYVLDLDVAAGEGKPFRVSFPLKVTGEMDGSGKNHEMGGMNAMMSMMQPFAGVSMMQEASGTSWEPASAPMVGIMSQSGRWNVMTHYNVSLNYDRQDGPRGDYQYNSTNWGMVMARRSVGKDQLLLRAMLTLEPLTVTPGGFPLLFQSGEQYHGHPLVDRQHPHDLFMEIAAKYTHPLGKDSAVYLYAAPAGEPALGPTAFMHRTSAMDIPAPPISHHWQDSTHIEFGVLTLGAWKRNVKVEGSWFTGREPDEYRYDFGPMKLDSFSGRISYNPGPNWSLQASYGYLHSPEALRPNEDTRRSTASIMYTQPRRDGGFWATSLIWGRNSAGGTNSDSYLLESELNLANRNTFFTRLEYVEKRGEELDLLPADAKHGITQWTLGYVRDVTPNRSYQVGIGGAVTLNFVPSELKSLYGDNPMGLWFFVRLRPSTMR